MLRVGVFILWASDTTVPVQLRAITEFPNAAIAELYRVLRFVRVRMAQVYEINERERGTAAVRAGARGRGQPDRDRDIRQELL